MKKPVLFIFFPALLFFMGCEDQCDPGPYFGEVKVKLTINDENPDVHVVIFEGKIEKGDTLISEYVSESPVYYELEAEKYYSATARYQSGVREVLAVDGKKMTTTSDDDTCEAAEDFTLNLKLAD